MHFHTQCHLASNPGDDTDDIAADYELQSDQCSEL